MTQPPVATGLLSMKRRLFLLVAASAIALGVAVVPVSTLAQGAAAAGATRAEIQRWERMAQSVDIIRDDWGIAHVYGPPTPLPCSA
jgi:acyl-homoserine lactone acylase PvdQ